MGRRVHRGERSIQHFRVGNDRFALLSVPKLPALPAKLTPAEREVVALLFEGRSNAEIARARGVSVRTVANQVASVLRKLGVGSRSALISRLARKLNHP